MVIGAYKPAFVDLVIETVAEHNLVLKTPRWPKPASGPNFEPD
jgi:putative lipoic acid-binding regulatory protein